LNLEKKGKFPFDQSAGQLSIYFHLIVSKRFEFWTTIKDQLMFVLVIILEYPY